jgi:hypothetical protein
MTTIHFEPQARKALAETYRSDESLSNLYDYNFDLLQANPIDARARRYRHASVDAWLIYIVLPGRAQQYAIEWTEIEGEVYVLYLGPWL